MIVYLSHCWYIIYILGDVWYIDRYMHDSEIKIFQTLPEKYWYKLIETPIAVSDIPTKGLMSLTFPWIETKM